MNQQLNENELLLWNAVNTLEAALAKGMRNAVVDLLTEEERKVLFEGYVLKEHYDCLAMGHELLEGAHDDCASY